MAATVHVQGLGDVYAKLHGFHTTEWTSPDEPAPKNADRIDTFIVALPFAIGACACA